MLLVRTRRFLLLDTLLWTLRTGKLTLLMTWAILFPVSSLHLVVTNVRLCIFLTRGQAEVQAGEQEMLTQVHDQSQRPFLWQERT